MRREHDEVQVFRVVVRLHIHGAVRGELRGIDQNQRSGLVRLARQPVDGLDEAGDVGRAGRPASAGRRTVELAVEIGLVDARRL